MQEVDGQVVEVVGVGEEAVHPHLATVTCSLSAHKASAELCRASVEKRREYTIQTFRQKGSESFRTEEDLQRKENDRYTLVTVVTATLPTEGAHAAVNVLMEKLGTSVTIDKITYHHAPEELSKARVVAGQRAAQEAFRRAKCMTEAVGASLGPPLALHEEQCRHLGEIQEVQRGACSSAPIAHTHSHTPITLQSVVRARFALVTHGVPKTKKEPR
ncbi:interleukin-1 receptor-associated kinase 1-binding protein 1-like [Oratosquilla oratoria]|uniref:interleukin-1 receptor-associated kinase 1-binding protein 1-like n=1 Tax=Oratosquilla oratoria TaxID=337810 RepID=UPI003F76EE56